MLHIFLAEFIFSIAYCANWAVLVAGSSGWSNYRHQSDVFHAYQVLMDKGFDSEHVILMAFDDIASNHKNFLPGQVFHSPDGPDIYPGSDKIQYRGSKVRPAIFLTVLSGNASAAGGPVIR
ncbi:MAG: putative vacuolar processing enzyme, partial [Streblomastix strix]